MKKLSITRADSIRIGELNELIAKIDLYPMSSPKWGSPTLLPFVKGLIFSSEIIAIAHDHINNGLNVDWGQIIDERGNLLSRENDIVIYKGPPYKKWNNKTMKFVLVEKTKVRVVIQCSSRIDTISDEHRKYCKDLKKFIQNIWYFAECCWAKNKKRIKVIENNLKKVGYSKFFYLYSINEDTFKKEPNENVLKDFIKIIERST